MVVVEIEPAPDLLHAINFESNVVVDEVAADASVGFD